MIASGKDSHITGAVREQLAMGADGTLDLDGVLAQYTDAGRDPVQVNGSIQVAGQRIQVGKVHARKLVTVTLEEHTITVYDADTPIAAVPRRSTTTLNRTKSKHQITATAG